MITYRINADIEKLMANEARDLDEAVSNFYANAAIIAHNRVSQLFEQDSGPDGPWKPLKKGRRRGGSKILQDTGRLKGSIVPFSGRDYAGVGTDLDYAPYHNYGTKHIPQREFMWLDGTAEERIMARLERQIFAT